MAFKTRKLSDSPIEELGTIEGVLKMVTVAGPPRFNVYDSVTGAAVICRLEAGYLGRVAAAIGRRVSVSGSIVYAKDGYPRRIKDITEFSEFAEDADLPTASDILKLGLDLTGGLTIEEFMAQRRDG